MLLFKEAEGGGRDSQSLPLSKREKFRREIRQTSLRARFEEIRGKLVEEMHWDQLGKALGGLKGRFDAEEFRAMVRLLESNEGSVHFQERMAEQKLEGQLVDVLLENELGKAEGAQVLKALSLLTYYSRTATMRLLERDEFVDHLRARLEKLPMNASEDLMYFNQALSLLMNIASEITSDFNHFLAESDLCLVLNRQLARTILPSRQKNDEYFGELVAEAREFALRLFKNIVQGVQEVPESGVVVARLLGDVLRDEENLLSYPERTFLLLAQAMSGGGKFWPALMDHPDANSYFIQICQALDAIQGRCLNQAFLTNPNDVLTPQEATDFFAAVVFLNELFYMSDDYEMAFVSMIENMLNGYMLAQFIIEAHKRKEYEHLVAGIQLVWHLSQTFEVTAEQLIVVRPADDPLALLKVVMTKELMVGGKTAEYCLDILQALLKKDRAMLPNLMQLNLLDKLMGALEHSNIVILMAAIELATETMTAANANGEGQRIYGLMDQMGMVKEVEKNLDHLDKTVYVKAEQFTDAIAGEKARKV